MSTSIEDLTARAKTLIAERKYQEAVRACRRVLLSRPEMVSVRLLLGMALLALRRHEEARAEMLAVLRKSPNEPAAHRLLGEAHLRAGQPDKARESLQTALALDPADEEAAELLEEVAQEDALPPSATIDRWFDPEAVATLQTDVPPFKEERTGQVRVQAASPTKGPFEDEPSIEVDPSLMEQAGRLAIGDAPDEEETLEEREPMTHLAVPRPRPLRRSSFPPPPHAVVASPGSTAPPRRSDLPPPSVPRRPISSRPPGIPGVPTGFSRTTSTETVAARDRDANVTSELRMDDLESVPREVGPAPVWRPEPSAPDSHEEARLSPLEAQPTLARPRSAPPPPSPLDESLDAIQTHARGFPSDPLPGPDGLEPGVMTITRGAPGAGARPPQPAPAKAPRKLPPIGVLAALVAVPLVAVVVGYLVVSSIVASEAEDAIVAAALAAEIDGLGASLDEALARAAAYDTSDESLVALRARLLATAVYEHGADADTARELVGGELASSAETDAAIARAYLALADGDVDAADRAVAAVTGDGAELQRARALVAFERHDHDRALVAAQNAVQVHPSSPRHVSLLALVMAEKGDVSAALASLDGVAGAGESAWVRVTRARILYDSGADPGRAVEEASAVLTQLADSATPIHRAWAHLTRMRQAIAAGDVGRAREDAQNAIRTRPAGDERFGLLLAEALLQCGASDDASRVLASLPIASRDPARRAALLAEVALENGEVDAAAVALADAGESPHTQLLRGRVAELRGEPEQALEHYQRAARDPVELVRANARLGAMALDRGDSAEAIELLAEAARRQPGDLEVVPLLVTAHLAGGGRASARAGVDAALSRSDTAPELLAANARVLMAEGKAEEALGVLRQVVAQRDDDADLQVQLGEAARAADEPDDARAAFGRALRLRARHPHALVGLAALALDSGDLAVAKRKLDEAETAGARGPRYTRLRAEIGVLEGGGEQVIEGLRAAAREGEDAALWVMLGRAQWQAELDRDATRSFERALRIDRESPEAHLGLALVWIRAGRLDPAASAIADAQRAGDARDVRDEFKARLKAARGRRDFELGRFDEATTRAREALELDAACGNAHLLLALVAEEEGRRDAVIEHLRAATAGSAPPPEAFGRLAVRLGSNEEGCRLAAQYMASAPRGYDAPDVRTVQSRCR